MFASSNFSVSSLARRAVSRAMLQASTAALILIGVALASMPASAAPRALAIAGSGHAAALAPSLDGHININTASGDQLQLLPGVGPATAAKIIEYRTRRPFGHPTHLMRIKGIGPKTFNAIRPYVVVEGETTLRAPAGP